MPQTYRTLHLNWVAFRKAVAAVPQEFGAGGEPEVELSLPLPDGRFARFTVRESPLMEEKLAAKFPDMKTYIARGIDDPLLTARLDQTPQGFHAIIFTGKGSIYIDPYWRDDSEHYISYHRRDFQDPAKSLTCAVPEKVEDPENLPHRAALAERPTGANLRTYRLALACTGEYATAAGGGTVNGTLGAMLTSVNRVSALYERDLAIRLKLVNNNDQLVFLDSATDPYTNTSGSTMLGENQTKIDAVIGNANYDIGHVFSTGGGGVAGLGVVGRTGQKARGVTGRANPVGDPFDIDYVAHEVGHQFGADHPFNATSGSCTGGNRNGPTAYEVGSGTTIMAYAGICSPQNTALNSDDYFHTISYDEIDAYTTTGAGNVGVSTATGNTAPTLAALSSFTVPSQTPFALTASATDPDVGDVLTYCWEEFDLGPAQDPTASPRDNGSSPIFRSFDPKPNPTRLFPSLTYILNNANVPPATIGSLASGEFLPTTDRTMTFRVTVRDNRLAGGGSNYASTTVTSTTAAGPFAITSHNSAATIAGGSSHTITWSVANTTAAPVSCSNVKISLSTDGGYTYPFVLAANTPNNGSANVTIPVIANVATTQGRIKVEAVGNIFFDVSDAPLTITSTNTAPALTITGSVTVQRGTPTPVIATVATVSDTNTPLTVAITDAPADTVITAIISGSNVNVSARADSSLVTTLTSRTYPVTLTVADSIGSTTSGTFNLIVQPNPAPTLGNYTDQSVPKADSVIVTPSAPPADANNNLGPSPASVFPTALPGGGTVTVNQTTGAVTASTAPGSTPGTYVIRVTVQDTSGAAVVKSFNLTVLATQTPPTVTSLTRHDPSPSNASTVSWMLTFSYAVSGVSSANFSLSGTATAGAAIGTPATTDGGVTWNVPVTTSPSDGTLTLNLANSTGQTPTVSTALPFAGETYTLTTTLPRVTTPTSAGITGNTATLGGTVASDGGSTIIERGVVYSISSANTDPLIGGLGVTKVISVGTTGSFTVNAVGLSPVTGYSFKAYATNSIGTTYTAPVSTFTTPPLLPTVNAPTQAAITPVGATLGGNVVSDGGGTITERGVVYAITSVNNDPLIGGTGVTKLTGTGTTGVFTVNATGLTQGTAYLFKAYATNSVGTSYTTPTSTFSTPVPTAPTVTTPTQTAIAPTSATLGGNVTSDGAAAITERGVVLAITSVNGDPVIGGTGVTKLVAAGTTGVFALNVTGLTQATGYSFKAYATNSVGTTYTTPVSTFTTPTVVVLTGTKSVGPSGDYTSLTNSGGLFEAININGVNGLLNVQITGDLTAEIGTVSLNALTGTTPSVKIFPSGAARIVSGSIAGALIRLNGADNVTLDGSLGGTGVDRSLSVTNTSTSTSSAVIWLQNNVTDGATNNTIKNLNVAGNGNTQTLVGIGSGSSTIAITTLGTGNNGNTIQNNSISKTQYGIICQGLSAAAKNTGTVITHNLINTPSPNHVAKIGILVGFQNGVQVTQNTVDGMTFLSSTDTFGISLGLTGITATGFTGNEVTNATITRNSIGKVTHTGTFSAAGIAVASATSGTTLIANNFITGVAANGTSPDIGAGIFLGGGTGSTTQVFSNSISMTGTVTGSAASFPSYALAIGGADPVVDVRNNVLLFTQVTNGTPIGYTIGTASTTFANLTSNYNVIFTTTGALFGVGKTGGLSTSGTSRTTLADWQTATGKDANSVFGNPLFTSVSDLHVTSLASPVSNSGTPIAAVPVDFDGGMRNATTPDVGADEFGANNLPTVATPTQSAITASAATLGGNVTGDGGTALLERGVVYSSTTVNSDPLIGGTGVTKVINAGTTGVFTVNATGLGASTGYSFKAYAINATGTSYTSPVSTFTTLSPLQNWRMLFYGTTSNTGNAADDSDPYFTGVPNLAVFAVLGPNQNPALVAAGMLPQPQIIGGNYVLTFTQPPGVSGVTYGAEWKTDLLPGIWTTISDTGTGGTHTFSVPIGSDPNLFIRLRVSTP